MPGAQVSARELRAVLRSAAVFASLDDLELLPAVALAEVGRLVPCDHVSYNEVGLDHRPRRTLTDPASALDLDLIAAFERLASQNPLITHVAATGDDSPLRFSDFLTLRELRELEIYRDFYKPLGVDHQMAFALTVQPSIIAIALNRERGDFTDGDRDVMDLLRPHLAAAHRRAVELDRLRTALAALGRGEGGERVASLTRRELQVALLSARGMTNAEAAVVLVVSPKTVSAHLERVYRKLGIHRRAELALMLRDLR